MNTWQLQDAKSKFSKVVDEALTNGPQMITKRGVESVVILSNEKFIELTKQKNTLLDTLLDMPKVKIDLERDQNDIREVSF